MDKEQFRSLLKEERELYLGTDEKKAKQMKKSRHKRYIIWRYMYYFRCSVYWNEVRTSGNNRLERMIAKRKARYFIKKKNIYSSLSGVEIGIESRIGRMCDIWHSGVVINGTIGENCTFHGNNIIGNKGKGHESEKPVLGSGVDVGAGAAIIGDVYIADDSIIGAGAVVTKSFSETGSIIVGVPGRIKEKKEQIHE